MTTRSKTGAYAKMDNFVKNVAYPDFITNDTALTLYYQVLSPPPGKEASELGNR